MKISGNQLFWMMFCFQVHYALTPALLYGKQDAWIICMIGGIAAVFLTIIMVKVSLLSQNESFVGYCQTILGKYLGKCMGLIYLIAWLMLTIVTLREWTDYVYLKLLPRTPVIMVALPMLILVIYVNMKGGIKAIARCSQIIGPVYFFISFIPFVMMLGIMDWSNLQPVYTDTGIQNLMKGTIPTLANMMGGAMLPLMLMGLLSEPNNLTKRAVWAIGLSSLWVTMAAMASILVVGAHQAPQMTLPWVDAIRSISILNFIQNVDAIAVFIYAFAHFISISASFFGTCHGFAQWFNIRQWKIIIGGAALVVLLCIILTSNIGHITNEYRRLVWTAWILPIQMFGIPFILLLMGSIKKARVPRSKS